MRGLRVKLLVLVLVALAASCGRRSHLEGAPHFIPSQILLEGDGSGLSVDRQLTRTWRDYDGDGVADRMDWDIDGDGVANLLDQYPFDEKKQGEDRDQDGIFDFIDLDHSSDPTAQAMAQRQEKIFKATGVVVLHGAERFTREEWAMLEQSLLDPRVREQVSYRKLKVLVRYSQREQRSAARSDYDSYWEQISFYPHADHVGAPSRFKGSLIHELGHVFAFEQPSEWEMFLREWQSWASPSRYGLSSPEEGFAENFAYQMSQAGVEFDLSRFDLLSH